MDLRRTGRMRAVAMTAVLAAASGLGTAVAALAIWPTASQSSTNATTGGSTTDAGSGSGSTADSGGSSSTGGTSAGADSNAGVSGSAGGSSDARSSGS